MEVLLLRRSEQNDYTSGVWVFPGGKVDAGDRQAHHFCPGMDDESASRVLGIAQGGLDFYVAAIRECFEETGLLLTNDSHSALMSGWRDRLLRRELSWNALCHEAGLQLAVDQLVYFSHWITPLGSPKRFDTRFFLAAAPDGQVAANDGGELVEEQWIRPVEVLARGDVFKLIGATRQTLMTLSRFDTAQTVLDWARQPREIRTTRPYRAMSSIGKRTVLPDESAYAEVVRLDPHGLGNVSCEIQPGCAVQLSSRVIRVTAKNGSVMTGPGTNSYLVGGGVQNEWAVIDPGPLDVKHVDALLAAAPGTVRWIFVTHTHMDHSPAAALLKQKTGAVMYGRLPAHPEWQDASFAPDHLLQGGERFVLPGDSTLRAIHTPGHASNHLCYLLEEEHTLFTGDHVMQASTVVINPPDGDMAAYLASLRALLTENLEWLAPGHGFLMAQPQRAIEWIINHRLQRETKVIAALRALGPADSETLLAQVYADVPERLHAMAMRSLTAHLLKLRDEGAARESNGRWSSLLS